MSKNKKTAAHFSSFVGLEAPTNLHLPSVEVGGSGGQPPNIYNDNFSFSKT